MQIGIMHSEALEDDKNENKLQCKKQDNSGFLLEYHIYKFFRFFLLYFFAYLFCHIIRLPF